MPLLDAFFAMIWFFLWVAWIVLLIRVIADIFRSDSSGWSKAFWCLFVIILPLLGVLIYLIAHGDDMARRETSDAMAAQAAQEGYIRSVAGTSASAADELDKLASLRDRGVITAEEFERQKAKVLS